jgi:hypothetical protein
MLKFMGNVGKRRHLVYYAIWLGRSALRPFAAPFGTQLWIVLVRVFHQYWRTPSYLYSKVALCLFSVIPNPSKSITKRV